MQRNLLLIHTYTKNYTKKTARIQSRKLRIPKKAGNGRTVLPTLAHEGSKKWEYFSLGLRNSLACNGWGQRVERRRTLETRDDGVRPFPLALTGLVSRGLSAKDARGGGYSSPGIGLRGGDRTARARHTC